MILPKAKFGRIFADAVEPNRRRDLGYKDFMLDVPDSAAPAEIVTAAVQQFCAEGEPKNHLDVLTAILTFAKHYAESPPAAQREFIALLKAGAGNETVCAWAQKHLRQA